MQDMLTGWNILSDRDESKPGMILEHGWAASVNVGEDRGLLPGMSLFSAQDGNVVTKWLGPVRRDDVA